MLNHLRYLIMALKFQKPELCFSSSTENIGKNFNFRSNRMCANFLPCSIELGCLFPANLTDYPSDHRINSPIVELSLLFSFLFPIEKSLFSAIKLNSIFGNSQYSSYIPLQTIISFKFSCYWFNQNLVNKFIANDRLLETK